MTSRILAADDDEHVRVIVETKLGEEYDVETVSDGSVARDRPSDPARERPDLVVLDVVMPDPGGFETPERIRGRADLANLPVVMLASPGREDDVLRALEFGADDFATKPCSPAELQGRARRTLT